MKDGNAFSSFSSVSHPYHVAHIFDKNKPEKPFSLQAPYRGSPIYAKITN